MIAAAAVVGVLLSPGLADATGAENPRQRPAEYRVRLTSDLRYADITATLPPGTARLFMDSVQAEHLPKGWATFVRDLVVRVDGRPIAVTATDGAAWSVPTGVRAPITLSYRIDLGFARAPWPAGNEQAGAAFPDALYVVGRALFIVGDAGVTSHVEFDLPAGWRASVPWRSAGSSSAFEVADFTALTRNAFVLGRHVSTRVRSGPFELELALPGQPPAVAAIVEPALRRVLDAYLDLFPGTPPTQYLMTFFRAGVDDGESFTHSASFTTSDSVTTAGLIVWGNFLAHELMHFWNGQRIRGAGPRTTWRWLAEGFTEYYANITLARQGIIATDLFLRRAERHIGNYLYFATAPALARMSLVEAGSNTGRNRFGVYDGGWTVAFCLDGLIREASDDKRSLDDFMRALWQRFSGDRPGYTVAGLDSLANQLAGVDLGGIIRQYVETQTTLPVAQCLGRVGLAAATKGYAAEAFLFPAPNANPAAATRGRAMFSPRCGIAEWGVGS